MILLDFKNCEMCLLVEEGSHCLKNFFYRFLSLTCGQIIHHGPSISCRRVITSS